MADEFDVVVVGGGPAGENVAAAAASACWASQAAVSEVWLRLLEAAGF